MITKTDSPPIPFFDLKEQNRALEPELKAVFDRVLQSGQFILGAEVNNFENKIGDYLGAKHAIGVSSGTDALLLALMTLDIGPGDEVLCPSFTFIATAGSIARTGATPVFCDVCPACFNLNPHDAAKRITKKTRAIIPVHLYGQSADMDPLMDLARAHDLYVIEDAAQALGAKYGSTSCGTIGHFGAFSFFPTKNLGGFGDGGLLTTNDDDLAEKARAIRVHGARRKYHHDYLGANFRLDALQAALLSVKLPHLNQYIRARRQNASSYTSQLQPTPAAPLSCCNADVATDIQSVTIPTETSGRHHTWNQYTLRFPTPESREQAQQAISQTQSSSVIYYPVPLHRQPCFQGDHPTLPVAEKLANQVLSLPIYPELSTSSLNDLAKALGSSLTR